MPGITGSLEVALGEGHEAGHMRGVSLDLDVSRVTDQASQLLDSTRNRFAANRFEDRRIDEEPRLVRPLPVVVEGRRDLVQGRRPVAGPEPAICQAVEQPRNPAPGAEAAGKG